MPPTARCDDLRALDQPALPPPTLAPVLPDLEWIVSGALAIDVLDTAEFAGELRDVDLRRARIGGAALWNRSWAVSLGGDLAHGGALGQASIAYYGLPVHIEIGRFPEPFGLIQQEVTAGQALMELPACLVLTPGYGLGLAATLAESSHSVALGVFAPTSVGDRIQRRHPEQAITMRVTGVPLRTRSSLAHVGTAFSVRRPRDDVIQFTAIPETVLLRDFHTQSAPLTPERYYVFGLELGVSSGPVLLQAEGVLARLPGIEGAKPSFSGGYAELGWTIGAERRGYRPARGVFGPVYSRRPLGTGGVGAFELAARYSLIDLTTDDLGDAVAEQGDTELRDLYSGESGKVRSLGVNWYATDDVKYSFEKLEIENESRSAVETATVYQGRVQIQFTRP